MTISFRSGMAAMAVFGLVSATPLFAASATRSAAALPLARASKASYAAGGEQAAYCAKVSNPALKLQNAYVQVDHGGKVLLDPAGGAVSCLAPAADTPAAVGAGAAAGGGFPFEILLGLLGAAGTVVGLTLANSGNDSAG